MYFGDDERGADFDSPAMIERVRTFDWASTPLGPMAEWPQSLRTAVDMVLHSGHAMCLIWGADRIHIYNDAYAPILGARHPAALGSPTVNVWPELWDQVRPLIDRTFAGESIVVRDQPLTMTRFGFEEETWWSYAYSPVRGENGEVAGLLNVCSDSTERMRAIRERDVAFENLREREAFTSSVLASSTDCIKVLDLDGRLAFMSEGGQQVMEVSDFNMIAGCPWPDFWAGIGNEQAVAALEAARRGEAQAFIGKASTMAGTPKWWHVAVSPIAGIDGQPDRILSVSRDITDLRASEEERERFVRMAENSSDFIGMMQADGRVFYMNEAARRLVGLEGTDIGSVAIADFIQPDQLETVYNDVLPTVDRAGHWAGELCFRHVTTGDPIPVLSSVFPITDTDGTQIGYGSVTRDYRELKRVEENLHLLNGELAHRLKNVLAVVQSVVQQTLRNADDMASASQALGARLVALGSATDVLTGTSWRSADLRNLATRTLMPHGTIGERILIDGPSVMLKPEISVAFALALHELATNAVKYGALSNDTGIVTLSWTVDGDGTDAAFSLKWREQGGPPLTPPQRRGFGSTLIERSLRSHFGGKAATDYRSDGLVFELQARLGDAAFVTGN
jgi:PAS domain S-box-containing protein